MDDQNENPDAAGSADAAVHEWDSHLERELGNPARAYTFDMDERADEALLSRFPHLDDAAGFLNSELKPAYKQADDAAVSHQKVHRWLAGVAIIGGGLAIGLAILQLALKHSLPGWTAVVGTLEGVAVVFGVAAVAVGLIAKYDCQWFIQRHIAERLRMLKFQAFGRAEFWSDDRDGWRRWVRAQRDSIMEMSRLNAVAALKVVKSWARSGEAEPFEPAPPACSMNEGETRAAAIFYRRKRVDFQGAFFRRQSGKFATEMHKLHRFAFPIFVLSILAVIAHFAADLMAHRAPHATAARAWELTGVWSLAFAALLPVAGFVVRAWIGAFERSRSAHISEAKQRALEKCSGDLQRDEASCAATMHHIAHVEHFLEHEHRE